MCESLLSSSLTRNTKFKPRKINIGHKRKNIGHKRKNMT